MAEFNPEAFVVDGLEKAASHGFVYLEAGTYDVVCKRFIFEH